MTEWKTTVYRDYWWEAFKIALKRVTHCNVDVAAEIADAACLAKEQRMVPDLRPGGSGRRFEHCDLCGKSTARATTARCLECGICLQTDAMGFGDAARYMASGRPMWRVSWSQSDSGVVMNRDGFLCWVGLATGFWRPSSQDLTAWDWQLWQLWDDQNKESEKP